MLEFVVGVALTRKSVWDRMRRRFYATSVGAISVAITQLRPLSLAR